MAQGVGCTVSGVGCVVIINPVWGDGSGCLFFFIKLKPLKKGSTTNYAPFAFDGYPGFL
jgi:hypothetical protein